MLMYRTLPLIVVDVTSPEEVSELLINEANPTSHKTAFMCRSISTLACRIYVSSSVRWAD